MRARQIYLLLIVSCTVTSSAKKKLPILMLYVPLYAIDVSLNFSMIVLTSCYLTHLAWCNDNMVTLHANWTDCQTCFV